MMIGSLEGFEPIHGEAEFGLDASVPPFMFYMHARDGKCLKLQITDFHSNTWQTFKTAEQLEDLRDEVGIGGSWEEFLNYLRDAFLSDNVKIILGGPTNVADGDGATSAKVTAQKTRGTPRISLSLEKLVGLLAKDTMGNISFELLKTFKHTSNSLSTEKALTTQLSQALSAEKEKSQKLQEQLDAFSFNGRKRGRNSSSQSQYPVASLSSVNVSLSQLEPVLSQVANGADDANTKTTNKPTSFRNTTRMAHARRAKQRGTRLADVDEE